MSFKHTCTALSLALSLVAAPALAQDIISSSGSGAEANSGSISGAESNGNQQGQSQNSYNAGIGSSSSNSDSVSGAISGSESHSGSISDQSQGQSQGQTSYQTQGQNATNSQGVSTNLTFNSTNRKHSYVGTNTPVMLAASSSFSSDYCGGTVSGGASVAPIGVSIGGAGTKFDNSCRYLRLAEKAGMLGANYHNMQQPEAAMKAMSLMSWAVCMAGPQQDKQLENVTMQACIALGLLGSSASPPSPPTPPVAAERVISPQEAARDNVDPNEYLNLPPKTPRGANDNNAPAATTVVTPAVAANLSR